MKMLRADLRTRRFWALFVKEALAAGGLLGLALGLGDVLFDEPFINWGVPAVATIVLACAIWGLIRAWPQPVERNYRTPNVAIRVIPGDLLDETGHIVVGATDTFDTKPPRIISSRSIQGQALTRLWGDDVELLDADLDRALAREAPIEQIQKDGKTQRYAIATVASVPQAGRRVYFVAYSAMNDHNEAHATTDAIWKSLLALWSAVSRDGNGGAVSIPTVGGGQSRIAQILPPQDSIRFIAFSFLLASRLERVCDELRIVVRPEDYEQLNRLEIQAFLDSLEMA
jgi:hypothetical protein